MRGNRYEIKSKLFKWQGEAAWYFVRIDEKTSENIKDNFGMMARGWGSLPVQVTLGESKWRTSIFPDKQSSPKGKGTYLLPIKSQIRKAEKINDGDILDLEIEIIGDKIEIKPPNLN